MSAACPEYGFDVMLRLAPGLPDRARRELFLAIETAAGARGLSLEGGGAATGRFTVTRDGGQAVDADREALAAWAATRCEVVERTLGPLVDLAGRPRSGLALELLAGEGPSCQPPR